MSSPAGSKGQLVRLLVLVILGGAAIVIVANLKSPLSVSESEVRRMVQKHELVGLTLEAAARKLQHQSPGTADGTVVFDFDQVKGWRAGSLAIDVIGGKVTAATWVSRNDEFESGGGGANDVRQDQSNGADGGTPQGQGPTEGIRAKNQGTGGRGPR